MNSAGKPVSGAVVLLYPEPAPGDIPATGSSITVKAVSQSVTDAAGRWEAKVPAGLDLTNSLVPAEDPSVNFVVQAWTPDGASRAHWFTVSTQASNRDASKPAGTVAMTTAGKSMLLDASSSTAPTDLALDVSGTKVHDAKSATDASGEAVVPTICSESTLKTSPHHLTKMGAAHSRAHYTYADFNLTKGTSSSLGVGWSTSGDWGTFEASGSTSVDESISQSWPRQGGPLSKNFESYFTVKKIRRTCFYPTLAQVSPTDVRYTYNYYIRPSKFEGGNPVADGPGVNYTYCRTYGAGSHYEISQNKAYEYAAGLHAFGAGLSARSGWNTHITEYIHFGRKRRLCGLNDYPGSYPKALQVMYPA